MKSDIGLWSIGLALAVVGFVVTSRICAPSGTKGTDTDDRVATNAKKAEIALRVGQKSSAMADLVEGQVQLPSPIRYAGKKSSLSTQEEAALEAPGRMNTMRNAIGIAMYPEAGMFKDCVSETNYEFIEVTIRFEVTSAEQKLRAIKPELVSAPEEVKECFRKAVADEYAVEALKTDSFIDGYRGPVDVYATIYSTES